jgi:hypothetical protein
MKAKLPKSKRFGRRYPWDRWFTATPDRPAVLVRGRDYDCMPHGMVAMIRNVACSPSHRVRVSLRVEEDTILLSVVGKLPPKAKKGRAA